MSCRAATFVLALACLATVPLTAQQQQSATPTAAPNAARVTESARTTAGPRLQPAYQSYEPAIGRQNSSAAAAAADRTTITISTLALVLLIVLLIVLIR